MSQEDRASTSSGETVASKPWPSVVALGERIVKELGSTSRADTLGKWMAHRIAELMELAKNAEDQPQQEAAQREAESLILRVWDRRERWGSGYPLQGLETAIKVLTAEAEPWERRNVEEREPWLRMLQRLQALHQREATICHFSAIVDIPLEKEQEWEPDLQHVSDAELELIEKLVLIQDSARSEFFTLDGQRIPNFGSHPPEERARLALEALQKIARERSELLGAFVLGRGDDNGDEPQLEEIDDEDD